MPTTYLHIYREHAFSVSVHFCIVSSGTDNLYVRAVDAASYTRKASDIKKSCLHGLHFSTCRHAHVLAEQSRAYCLRHLPDAPAHRWLRHVYEVPNNSLHRAGCVKSECDEELQHRRKRLSSFVVSFVEPQLVQEQYNRLLGEAIS